METFLIDDIEIREYCEKAYSMKFGIAKSTLYQYANRLKKIKEFLEIDSLKEFGTDDRKLAQHNWNVLVGILKENYAKSTASIFIAALISFCDVMEVDTPKFIKHQKGSTFTMVEKSIERKQNKEENIQAIMQDFNKIYDADISLRDKFLVIHCFFCGMRRSEVSRSLISDEKTITVDGKKYRTILIRAVKTKEVYERIIIEDKYWECRDKYIKTLSKDGLVKGVDDFLFPGRMLDIHGARQPISPTKISQIIGGYWNYNKDGTKTSRHEGVGEIVWGKRIWSHIFRHARTNDLLGVMPIEAVQQWRRDASISTTRIYASEEQIKRQMVKALDKKPKDSWS